MSRKWWAHDSHSSPNTLAFPHPTVFPSLSPTPKQPHLAGVSASVEVPSTHHPWGKVTVIDQVTIALPEVDKVDLHLPEEGGCLLFIEVEEEREDGKGLRLWITLWPSSCPPKLMASWEWRSPFPWLATQDVWAHTPLHQTQLTTYNKDICIHGQTQPIMLPCMLHNAFLYSKNHPIYIT